MKLPSEPSFLTLLRNWEPEKVPGDLEGWTAKVGRKRGKRRENQWKGKTKNQSLYYTSLWCCRVAPIPHQPLSLPFLKLQPDWLNPFPSVYLLIILWGSPKPQSNHLSQETILVQCSLLWYSLYSNSSNYSNNILYMFFFLNSRDNIRPLTAFSCLVSYISFNQVVFLLFLLVFHF